MMKLAALVDGLIHRQVSGSLDLMITGITYHSSRVSPGDLFFCLPGTRSHGSLFIREAIAKGASAIVTDKADIVTKATIIVVPDTRLALALMSANFYDYPSHELVLTGVTGTNGKTTTTCLIDSLLQSKGVLTGLIGTVSYRIGAEEFPSLATTPEASDLQQFLRRMVAAGAAYATMEVSSHALAWHRTVGCDFDTVVLTNITGDHLDFHRTFAHYLSSKSKLFSRLGSYPVKRGRLRRAVLNGDDPHWQYIADQTPTEVVLYGLGEHCQVRAVNIRPARNGVSYDLDTPYGRTDIRLKLPGLFSVYNSLAALSVCLLDGMPLWQIREVLMNVSGVAGRFELVEAGQEFTVIVDYAHTPDGLENVLRAVSEFAAKRVITVFGCGGERDRSKRPLMGEVAAKYSDYCVITSDNPRGEDPRQIFADILPGITGSGRNAEYEVIPDRRQAIAKAIGIAEKDDVVLIAGKGHESVQIFKEHTVPFDDRLIARETIMRRLNKDGNDVRGDSGGC